MNSLNKIIYRGIIKTLGIGLALLILFTIAKSLLFINEVGGEKNAIIYVGKEIKTIIKEIDTPDSTAKEVK